nr:MAG TPA: hypothetical protein [Caudoviricetes sp.]
MFPFSYYELLRVFRSRCSYALVHDLHIVEFGYKK